MRGLRPPSGVASLLAACIRSDGSAANNKGHPGAVAVTVKGVNSGSDGPSFHDAMKADSSQEYAKSTDATDSDMGPEEYAKFVETVLSMTPPLATGHRLSYS